MCGATTSNGIKAGAISNVSRSCSRPVRCSLAAVIGILLVAAAVFVLWGYPLHRKTQTFTPVTIAQVKEHRDDDDCWLSIHEKVYDLSSYGPEHPGGEIFIYSFCGTNATEAFDEFHEIELLKTARSFQVAVTEPATPAPTLAPTTLSPSNTPSLRASATPSTSPPTLVPTTVAPVTETPTVTGASNAPSAPTSAPSVTASTAPSHSPPTSFPSTPLPTDPVCFDAVYSPADIALHASRDDCWYSLYGLVWDMTDYLDKHKGGAAIMLPWCGQDEVSTVQAYEKEKKHDLDLLYKKTPELQVGRIGTETSQIKVDCETRLPIVETVVVALTEAPVEPIVTTPPPTMPPTPSPIMAVTPPPTLAPVTPPPVVMATPMPSANPTPEPTENPTLEPTPEPTEAAAGCMVQSYTVSEIARHSSRDDCWYSLYGKVWDVTDYLDKHKGGAIIMLPWCGKSEAETIPEYEAAKKHDEALLYKKTPELEIGIIGDVTGMVSVAC